LRFLSSSIGSTEGGEKVQRVEVMKKKKGKGRSREKKEAREKVKKGWRV